jgi:PAS domain S-box-containing protein
MTQAGAASIRLLYVDDEPDFAELVATQLERDHAEFSVDVHSSASDALEQLRAEDPGVDCVVSDFEMPDMDGLAFLEVVREEWPDLPFVLFTGRGSENIASEAISAGVTEYMQKATDPQQFEVLANRVRNAVEKYQTERQLERTETRYRRLVEQNLTGIYIIQDGEVMYANPKCEEIFGYEKAELESMTAFDLVAEEDHGTLRENIRKREDGEVEDMNYTLTGVRKSGERFEFDVHSGSIDHEGEPALLGSLIDVTEQRERERELEEYRELVDTVGDPMYVLDEDGFVLKANRAMSEMLGYDREELLGKHPRDFLDEESLAVGRDVVAGMVAGQVDPPQTFEVLFRTADGEEVPCEANVTELTDEDGEFRGSVGVVRVIADRKARERELEEYETIVETAPDGIFILDDEGYLVSGNQTGAEMVGIPRDEAVGTHFSELVQQGVLGEEVADQYLSLVKELLDSDGGRQEAKFETSLRPKDAGERTCEVHIALLPEEDGGFRGTVGVVRDITERKSIEEALRTERDRLSALFENIPEPSVVYEFVDGEPVVRRVNDAFERVFGYDEAAVLGGGLDDYIVPPDFADEATDLNERVIRGESLDIEIKRLTADGEVRDFLLRNAPIPTDEGTQGYAIYTDITERKQSEERVQALFEHSTDSIVETEFVEGDPVVRRVNDAFAETVGFDAEDLVDKSIDEFIVPDGEDDEASRINRRIRNGDPVEQEVTRRTARGDRDFLLRAILFDVGEGNWTYAVYTDITERKERERRLEALHEATRDLMDATASDEVARIGIEAAERVLGMDLAGFFRHDTKRDILEPVQVTDRARSLFGTVPTFERGEGLAWQVFDSGKPAVADNVRKLEEVYNPETPVRSEMILPMGDHGLFMAASTEPAAVDQAEQFLAQVLVSNVESALDRARRERMLREREQALLRQNERLEEFAGVVSHDLRSPLTVAKGNVYLARQKGDGYLDEIESALDRMEQLIDDLLSLARQGETVDETELVDLSTSVEEAWSTVETGRATVELADGGDRRLAADEGRLRELLENLFGNAVEHGSTSSQQEAGDAVEHGGSDVTVRVGTMDNGFYVEDDGEGFDGEADDDLFEPGFTTEDQGTGFGLSIVRQIAEAHGWEVAATEGSDGGARFEFTGVETLEHGEATH